MDGYRMPSGMDVLDRLTLSFDHREEAKICGGGCGLDLSREALTNIVYAFGECDCKEVEYLHLVERLWHRSCFAAEFAEEAGE